MKRLEKNTPVFFRRLPVTENTLPNAVYLGYKGDLPCGPVHQLLWHSEKWIVGDNDFLTKPEALARTALELQKRIDGAKKPGMKLPEIASALGMSAATLTQKLKLIRNHLPETPKAA